MVEDEVLFFVYLGAIMSLVFIVECSANLKAGFCNDCRRFAAMQFTGVIELRKGGEEWAEYHCKFCDVSRWRIRRKGVASGGDAGTGGCAGSGCGGGCGG